MSTIPDFLSGGGDAAAEIAAIDWTETPIGPIDAWPVALRIALASLLGSAESMFLAWGPDRLLFFNDAFRPMFGGRASPMGQPMAFVWAHLWDAIGRIVDAAYAGRPHRIEDIPRTIPDRPEEKRFWTFSYSPLRDETGAVRGMVCVTTETTGRVTENQQRQQEVDRFREMFDQAPSFAAVLEGPEHRFFLANPAYRRLVGERALRGRTIREALPELAGQPFLDMLDAVYRTGEAQSGHDMAVTLPDGAGATTLRHLDFVYQPIRDAAGQATSIFVEGTDATARHAASQALRDSEAHHRQIVDSALDTAIIAFDREGLITRWSEGARRLFGWTDADMLGNPAARLLPIDEAGETGEATIARLLAEALDKGGVRDERWYLRQSATRFRASGAITPIRDQAGMCIGFVSVLSDRTAEYRAAETLRQAELRLSRAQRAGKVGTFSIGIARDRIAATPEFCRIFGLPEQAEVPAATIESLVIPEDRHAISNLANRTDGTAPHNSDYRIRRPDTGEVRWIARRGEIERGEDGRPLRFVGIVQDVTDQRLAQQATQESAAQFAALTQAMPNQVWTAAAGGGMQWANDRLQAYTGLDQAAILDQGWKIWVHPDDVDATIAAWRSALAGGANYETEFRMRRHDGAYRWHLARAVPVRDADGAILRWIGTNVDVEDQRAARETLRDLNRELERRMAERTAERDRMWQLANDILIVLNIRGIIEVVNPAWTGILGWSETEMIGTNIVALIHDEDRDRGRAELGTLSAGEPVRQLEIRMRHRDGSYRFITWTAVPDDGHVHAVGRDTTESRNLEEQLRQSQKMEAVGQLTGGIAHDFNNLLTGIIGSIEMLQRRVGQGRIGELDRYTGIAMDSALRAAALTQRLLAFSRRQSLAPRAVDVDGLVEGMADLLRRSIGESIRLDHVATERLWRTRCDPSQLENAILNLAINARDAMPDGGTLRIVASNCSIGTAIPGQEQGIPPGDHVCLSVSDDGEGMSAEVMARAFEPFFTTKPIGKGTGLGLSMIYGFARQSNGAVVIASSVGQGTTVRLYLPRHEGIAVQDPTAGIAALGDEHRAPAGETVLVVEDEEAVRGLIVDVLSDLGYRPLEAVDGPSGLAILRSDAMIDLLVTDVGLPGLNGRQLADAAREARPDLRILFVTGYAHSAATREDFIGPGMELITKPFAVETLATRIRAMVTPP